MEEINIQLRIVISISILLIQEVVSVSDRYDLVNCIRSAFILFTFTINMTI